MIAGNSTTPVDDESDPRLVPFRLRDRALIQTGRLSADAPAGLFAAEGDLVVERALAAGHRVHSVLVASGRDHPVLEHIPDDVPILAAGEALRARVTGLGVQPDVLALFHRPASRPDPGPVLATGRRLVVLEAVDNPTNLGVLVRSAAALGADGVVLDPTSADPLARRAVRASMGAVFAVPVVRAGDLASDVLPALRARGVVTIALTPDPSAPELASVVRRDAPATALLLGSERAGLSGPAMHAATVRARLPMHHDVDSLNVAAAAAIACYALGPPPG